MSTDGAFVSGLCSRGSMRADNGYGGRSRHTHFEEFDRRALQALPAERFVHADRLQARVNVDYHVEVDRHYHDHDTYDDRQWKIRLAPHTRFGAGRSASEREIHEWVHHTNRQPRA